MRGPAIWVAAMTLSGALSGCGSAVVVAGEPGGSPYAGPLDTPAPHDDVRDVRKRAGAAGAAVQCDPAIEEGRPDNGGGADYDSGLSRSQATPQRAIANWFDEDGSWFSGLPRAGYVEEATRDGHVLYSYDVDGRTKAAVIVSEEVTDWRGNTGWGVSSWAVCDPAELPAELTDDIGIWVWTDAGGHRVATSTIRSAPGPEHCDWQEITFLSLGGPTGAQYLSGDAGGDLADNLLAPPATRTHLPKDAVDSGYQRDGRRLLLAADRSAAYLVDLDDPTDVQRWPRAREPIYCA